VAEVSSQHFLLQPVWAVDLNPPDSGVGRPLNDGPIGRVSEHLSELVEELGDRATGKEGEDGSRCGSVRERGLSFREKRMRGSAG